MHDAITLEKRGIPSVVVISEAFVQNAKAIAKLSGIPDYPFIVVPHPVSSLDAEGLEELVKRFFPQVLELLLARPTDRE